MTLWSLLSLKLVPLLLVIAFGALLRRGGVLSKERCEFLLQLVIYVALPATILKALQQVQLRAALWILPVTATLIVLSSGALAYLLSRKETQRPLRGTLQIAPMVMNLGTFVYPFVLAVYGEIGLSYIVFLDFANVLLSASLVYVLAAFFGSARRPPASELLRKLARFPLFWAMLVALGLRLSPLSLPQPLWNAVGLLGELTIPLSLLAMGGFLEFQRSSQRPRRWRWQILATLAIRFGGGLCIALGMLALFRPHPLLAKIILLAAAAPIGFTVLAYAAHEDLDAEAMAQLVSLSLLVGLLLTPALLLLLSVVFP